MPQSTQKNSAVRHAPPLAGSASKPTAWAGRGPHPAPRLALFFKKTAVIFRGRKLKNGTFYLKLGTFSRLRWKTSSIFYLLLSSISYFPISPTNLLFCLPIIFLPSFLCISCPVLCVAQLRKARYFALVRDT